MTLKNLPVPPVVKTEPANSSFRSMPPVIPTWVQRAVFLLDDPLTTAESVAEMVSLDKGLSHFLCVMAGPAKTGGETGGQSLVQAVETLGFKQVQALILSTAASSLLAKPLDGYRQSNGQWWEHSISTAANARWIAQSISYPGAEQAYAAGLVHDIGKPLLDSLLQKKYHQIVESLWKRKLSLWQAEQLLLNTDHAEAGGVLALQWGFPLDLVEAIRYHHLPGLSRIRPELAAIVHVANIFAPQFTQGLSSLGSRNIHPAALRILNLDIPQIESMRAKIWKEQIKNESFYTIPPVLAETLP